MFLKKLWRGFLCFVLPGGLNPKFTELSSQLSSLAYEKTKVEIDRDYFKGMWEIEKRSIQYQKNDIKRLQEDMEALRKRLYESQDKVFHLRNENIELKLRGFQRHTYTPDVIPHFYLTLDVPKEIFDVVYRALANKYHPDRNQGGSQEKMKEINGIRDQLYSSKGWK